METVTKRKLPIGLQTLREIREDGWYYVDKTGYLTIHRSEPRGGMMFYRLGYPKSGGAPEPEREPAERDGPAELAWRVVSGWGEHERASGGGPFPDCSDEAARHARAAVITLQLWITLPGLQDDRPGRRCSRH